MNFNVTLQSISKQLDRLEQFKPETQAAVENALNDLQKISKELLEALTGRGSDINPGEMLVAPLILNRIIKLNDLFIKQCPMGITLNKIKEMAKNTRV